MHWKEPIWESLTFPQSDTVHQSHPPPCPVWAICSNAAAMTCIVKRLCNKLLQSIVNRIFLCNLRVLSTSNSPWGSLRHQPQILFSQGTVRNGNSFIGLYINWTSLSNDSHFFETFRQKGTVSLCLISSLFHWAGCSPVFHHYYEFLYVLKIQAKNWDQ